MEAKIVVKDKVATGDNTVFVCGNTDYTIKFDFDEEWSAESVKTARFIYNDQFQEVVFEGDTCAAPAVTDTIALAIGVYAGNLRTTTPAFFNCATSILCGSETHADPPQDVYDQLIELWNSKGDSDAVRFTKQTLTDEQKAQARENIGAAAESGSGGDAPSGGGGASPYKTLYSQTLEEAGAVSVTMDDEAAACNDYLMYLAVPKGDAAVSFNYKTTVFGAMYAVNNVRAVDASYGTLVVVSAVRTSSSFMLFETKITQTATGTPNFSTAPRMNFGIPQIQHISAENTSVLFSSAIELPAGTQILILGR